jgi:hypothetical protein
LSKEDFPEELITNYIGAFFKPKGKQIKIKQSQVKNESSDKEDSIISMLPS